MGSLPDRTPARSLGAVVLLLACGAAAAGAQNAEQELRVTLLHTSDEHSALLPAPLVEYEGGEQGRTLGGFARLGGALSTLRAERERRGEPILLSSAGDHTGGTPFNWLVLYGSAPELALMRAAGYDVITLGNHEFDFGPELLARAAAAAGFPGAASPALVATNARIPASHPLGDIGLLRSHLVELENGLRVGYIGLLGREAARVAPLAPPVAFEDPATAARAAVAELQAAGAHIVVAVTHSGLEEDRELARRVPGIHVILGGHDHRLLDAPVTEAGTVIMHPGAHLRQVAQLELGYHPVSGRVRVRNAETGAPWFVRLGADVPEDPGIAALIDTYRGETEALIARLTGGRFGDLGERVVRSAFVLPAGPRLRETPFGNFVTDAMRAAAAAATGRHVDFVFQANGVIRADLVRGEGPDNLDRVTLHDLLGPVGMGSGPDGAPGYPLVSVWLSGEEVRRVLEVSVLLSGLLGNSYYLQVSGLHARYDPRRALLGRVPFRGTPIPSGRAVIEVQRDVAGELVPLARGDTALYHVVTDRYVASFLPMVGRIVPRLAIVPRDEHGQVIADLDDAIISRNGRELKVWQAVLEFAAAQPRDAAGEPRIPDDYAAPAGRLVIVRALPLWFWPLAVLVLLLALLIQRVHFRRGRGAAAPAAEHPGVVAGLDRREVGAGGRDVRP
jgi:5'-nucleotidase / UDP-sugar diphosphatase